MFPYFTAYMKKNFSIYFSNLVAFLLRIPNNIFKFLKDIDQEIFIVLSHDTFSHLSSDF